jgi:hypothetical protein
MLRSGVLVDGDLKKSDDGTPQGSIASPVLSNIFAHYAIDVWMKEVVPKYLRGKIHVVRYADDFCICTNRADAPRILEALEKRLERFSLEMNSDKTEVIDFSRNLQSKGVKQGTFKFLGFTLFLGRSRSGKLIVKIKTNGKVFAVKLKAITEWCKKNRNKFRLRYLWKTFQAKIRGHIQYYGVSHNFASVSVFIFEAKRIFFKWINRRSQKKSFDWKKFDKFEKLFPLPKARIVHHFF